MNLIAATDVDSEHPLAQATIEHAEKLGVDEGNHTQSEANSFISVTGHSVKAIVRSKEIIVGQQEYKVRP